MRGTTRGSGLLERGVAAAERGRVAEGFALIREACRQSPEHAEAHAQHARWLSRLHAQAEAHAAVERALAAGPCEARTLDTLGVVLARGGLHERAADCFRRAVELEPAPAGRLFNLATSLKFLGRLEQAEHAYEECLRRDPAHVRAHHGLATLRTWTPGSNHVDRLRFALAEPGLDVDSELVLRHALAKELDDAGRHSEAFAELAAAKRRKRAAVGYDFARDRALFEAARKCFPEPLPTAGRSATDAGAPIFVVGLPRTGTTLVERILASHSQVASAGESQNFGVLLKRAARTPSPHVLDAETLREGVNVDLAAIGREYVARTRPVGDSRPRFVDKLPLNFFYLGHVARALPQAGIVVVRRDPLDAVAAGYRQLFATHVRYYDYALTPEDAAAYCVEFERLVAHWRAVLPGRVHEVRYEELVRRQQPVTAELLEACGLTFETACLEFHRNPAPTATASSVQVRQPLHASSVGRWRRNAAELAGALAVLRRAGLVDLSMRA